MFVGEGGRGRGKEGDKEVGREGRVDAWRGRGGGAEQAGVDMDRGSGSMQEGKGKGVPAKSGLHALVAAVHNRGGPVTAAWRRRGTPQQEA